VCPCVKLNPRILHGEGYFCDILLGWSWGQEQEGANWKREELCTVLSIVLSLVRVLETYKVIV